MTDTVSRITANDIAAIIENRAEVEDGLLCNAGYIAHEIYLSMLAASPQGEGSSADADTHRAADGVVLDASQIKAVEHAVMDAGAHSWRRARLAMVEEGQIIGYPLFSRADMAELARLYHVTEGVKP